VGHRHLAALDEAGPQLDEKGLFLSKKTSRQIERF
jgi:hypothetical protein